MSGEGYFNSRRVPTGHIGEEVQKLRRKETCSLSSGRLEPNDSIDSSCLLVAFSHGGSF